MRAAQLPRNLRLAAATLFAAIGITVLALSLPPEGFFAGDSGLKLIAALNAIEHPLRPFEVDLPQIAGRPVPYVDPMVGLHDDHAHALQSPVFPVLSAPFIAALGLRGAYVLPALAFIALVPCLFRIRDRNTPEASIAILAAIVILGNPTLFYALEYWEHAPAVALLAGSTALALGRRQDLSDAGWVAVSGALGGLAITLRPEALWYVAGLGLVIGYRHWLAFCGGAAAILLPFAIANYVHSGDALGLHASRSLAPLQVDYFAGRWQRMVDWLWPQSALATVGLGLIATAWVASIFKVDHRLQQLIALLGVAVVSVLAGQRLLPRESLWQAFPVALLGLIPTGILTAPVRNLYITAAVTAAGILLTAAHSGGAQWGSRFLLVMAPAVMVLAANGATSATGHGRWRAVRVSLVVITLIAALATSRVAYQELRGSKRAYEGIVAAAASVTSPGDVILTNVWWFDQITASLYGSRTFLYAANSASAADIVRALHQEGTYRLTLVSTAEDGGGSLDTALHDSCFRITAVRELPIRELRFASALCMRE